MLWDEPEVGKCWNKFFRDFYQNDTDMWMSGIQMNVTGLLFLEKCMKSKA